MSGQGGPSRDVASDGAAGRDARRPARSASAPPQSGAPGARGGRPGSRGDSDRPRLDDVRRAELEQRVYDPRREERRKATRLGVPDDVDARMLDPEVRRELRSLARETADLVARHLVVTGRTLDDDPAEALAHARAARAMAGRIGVVREASGLAAYAAGEWNEALSELRAARRITGRPEHLAVMADCERALGRPERALAYADDPAVRALAQDERVELVIVLAGARRDLGQADAAVLTLQDPARRTTAGRPWAARLWYAYADALLGAGRPDEARTWFEKVVHVDADGQTDAGDRLLELDGIVVDDLDDDEVTGVGLPDEELAAYVAEAFPPPPQAAPAGSDEVDQAPAGSDEVEAVGAQPDEPASVGAEPDEPASVEAGTDQLESAGAGSGDAASKGVGAHSGAAASTSPSARSSGPGPQDVESEAGEPAAGDGSGSDPAQPVRPATAPASLMPLFTGPGVQDDERGTDD